MKTLRSLLFGLLGVSLVFSSGCITLHDRICTLHDKIWKDKKSVPPTVAQTLVRVGGSVHKPGEYEFGERATTLRDAINLAGGLRSTMPTSTMSGGVGLKQLQGLGDLQQQNLQLEELFKSFVTAFEEYRDAGPDQLGPKKGQYQKAKRDFGVEIEDFKTDVEALGSATSSLIFIVNDSINEWEAIIPDFEEFRDDRDAESGDRLAASLNTYPDLLRGISDKIDGLTSQSMVSAPVMEETRYLVSLRRDGTMPRVTYYLLYDEVMKGGIAGGITLADGDVLAVVPAHDTSLNSFIADRNLSSARGLGGTLSSQVTGNDLASRFNQDQLTTVLIRASGDMRSKDVYLIPTRLALDSHSEDGLGSLNLANTDLVNVAPTFAAPLFADSVIGSIVADVVADRVQINRPEFSDLQSASVELQRTGENLVRDVSTKVNRLGGF